MDSLTKALAFDDTVRIVAVVSTDLVQTAVRLHDTGPTAGTAFGRLLTATLLLGATKKGDEQLTLQVDGDGPIGTIVGTTLEAGEVYGTLSNPHAERPLRADGSIDVPGVIGDGFLTAIRRIGIGDPYMSAVRLATGEIGDDIAAYLSDSEQVNSAVGVGVRFAPDGQCIAAGGFLVQVLGGATEDQLEAIESRLSSLSKLSAEIAAGASAESIVEAIGGGDIRVLDRTPARYRCPRDRQYFVDRLAGLGRDTLYDAFAGTGRLEVVCDYCRRSYEFTPADLANELN